MPDFSIVVNGKDFEVVPNDGSGTIQVSSQDSSTDDTEAQMLEAIAKADGYGSINKILHALLDAKKNIYDIEIN